MVQIYSHNLVLIKGLGTLDYLHKCSLGLLIEAITSSLLMTS